MKILNNEQVLKTFQHESNFKAQPPSGTAFGAILKETFENTTTAALVPMQTTYINPLAGLQPAASSPSAHPGQARPGSEDWPLPSCSETQQ